jgi:beta-lactam-binding protein with PASTA domain
MGIVIVIVIVVIVVVVGSGIARVAPSSAMPRCVVEKRADGHLEGKAAKGEKALVNVVPQSASEATEGRVVRQELGAER